MKVSNSKMVSVTYDLTAGEGSEKELMERATAENPLVFLFGMGMMLPAFEENLKGLGKGDKFSFTLKTEEAYGEYQDDAVVELPKSIFEIDGVFDSERVTVDTVLPMMDADGNRLNGTVEEVTDEVVIMNFNHPLAGEDLTFEGEILDVHEPTAEEIAALSGGGCGCGCDSCEQDCGDGGCSEEKTAKGGCGCGCGN